MATSTPKRTPAQLELEALQLARSRELEREKHTDATRLAITRRRMMLGELGFAQLLYPGLPTAQRHGDRLTPSLTEPAVSAADAEDARKALLGTFATNFSASLTALIPQRGGRLS